MLRLYPMLLIRTKKKRNAIALPSEKPNSYGKNVTSSKANCATSSTIKPLPLLECRLSPSDTIAPWSTSDESLRRLALAAWNCSAA